MTVRIRVIPCLDVANGRPVASATARATARPQARKGRGYRARRWARANKHDAATKRMLGGVKP